MGDRGGALGDAGGGGHAESLAGHVEVGAAVTYLALAQIVG